MPLRRGGLGIPLCYKCGSLRTLVLPLVLLCVLAQLLVFSGRIRNFNPSRGDNYFLVESSTIVQPKYGKQKQAQHYLQGNEKIVSQDFSLLTHVSGVIQNDRHKESFLQPFKADAPDLLLTHEGNLAESTGQPDVPSEKHDVLEENTQKSNRDKQVRRQLMLHKKAKRSTELMKQHGGHQTSLSKQAILHSEQFNGLRGKHSISNHLSKQSSNSLIRKMRDQLNLAKAYVGSASIRNRPRLLRDLKLHIQETQRMLGNSHVDADLPKGVTEKFKALEQILSKAQYQQHRCDTPIKKLSSLLLSTEEAVQLLKREDIFFNQLTARTVPKGLHCLAMQLTIDYHASSQERLQDSSNKEKLENLKYFHYAIFTDNILAASVVINSTIVHAKEPKRHVFHIVTDTLHYAAMKMWFLDNTPGNATVEVKNWEAFTWQNSYFPVLRQLQSVRRENLRADHLSSSMQWHLPKDLSLLNHLQFYLPEIFPMLDKILLLEEDIVVQKDLTALWNINFHGKVIGAVEACGINLHRFDKYLNFSNEIVSNNFNGNSCVSAHGMNLFDLQEWKQQNLTGLYQRWHLLNKDKLLWKHDALSPFLVTFYNLTFPLDKSWHLLGLGYNSNITKDEIHKAAVIHYSGHMKPWLEIGMKKYKFYWTKYVNYDHPFLQECNISK